jgi:hypothetical protein
MAATLTLTQQRLVHRIATLHREAQEAGRTALHRACEAGRLLGGLPRPERDSLLREAGISPRTGQVYLQVAANWPVIEARLAQHAAPSLSIRAALREVRSEHKTKTEPLTLRVNYARPEELFGVLQTVAGRAVSLTIKVKRDRQDDPRQPWLPFD